MARKRKNPFEDIGASIGGVGSTATATSKGKKHKTKKAKKILRRVRHAENLGKKATGRGDKIIARKRNTSTIEPDVASENTTDPDLPSWKPKTRDILGDQIEADIRAADPGAIHPVVGALSEGGRVVGRVATTVYGPGKVARFTKVIPKIIGKIAKPATKSAAKQAEKVAVKQAKATGRTAARKVAPTTKGQKALDKQIRDNARLRVRVKNKGARAASPKYQWKKHRPTILAGKVARAGARNERIRKTIIAGGVSGGTLAGPGAALLQNTTEATVEDPGAVAGTSIAGLGALATAPVAIGAAGYTTAKNIATGHDDPLAPAREQVDAYGDYLKDYPELVNPGSDKAQKLIQQKYGLTPVLTAALGVQAATRLGHRVLTKRTAARDVAPERKLARQGARPRRVSKLRDEAANSPSADKANAAARALSRAESRGRGRRVGVATELNRAGHRSGAAFDADMAEKATIEGKTKTFAESMRDLNNVPIGPEGYTAADAVSVVHTYGTPLEANAGRAALIRLRDSLRDPKVQLEVPESVLIRLRDSLRDPKVQLEVPGSVRETRVILNALIEDPDILEHSDFKRTEIQLRAIRKDQAAGPNPADPRDRARLVALAREHKVSTPEEMIPHELRGRVKMKVRKYQDGYRKLRARANTLAKNAKANERAARQHKQGDPKRVTLERRAAEQRVQAEEIRAVVNRPQRAKHLDRQAYLARKAGDERAAANFEGEALGLRQKHQAAVDRLDNEFHAAIEAKRRVTGQRDPIFFHDLRAHDAGEPVRGGKPVNAAGAARADKVKLGKLREQGLVDESGQSLIESLYRDRANAEMNGALKRILGEHRKGELLTGTEARNMVASGKFPAGHSLIPLQDFKRAYARGESASALGILDEAANVKDMRALIVEADFQSPGKKYAMIPTSVLNEVYDQAKGVEDWAKNLRKFGAVQSLLLLGTSPSWAFYQGFATPLTLLARHPNPVTWVKAARDLVRLYKRFTPRERAAFAALFGGNVGEIIGHYKLDELKPGYDQIRSLSDASKIARSTWAGKILNSFAKGGPLIQGVAKWEAMLRTGEALAEIDKLHGRTSLTRWVNDLADLDAATRKQIDDVQGMSFDERIRYFSDPDNTKPIEKRVTSTLGNWTALTAREKRWSGAFIFYPFLRFSLKWAFHTFPRDNPIKAAILLNLAQQNSDEVKHMLGGTPSFVSSLGQIPIRGQDGNVTGSLNMARAAPASNALTEQLGGAVLQGQTLNLSMLGRVVQPAIGAMILQGVGGLDPFTGQSVGGTIQANFATMAKQLVGLSPIGRAWGVPLLEQNVESLKPSPTAEHFRDLDGRGPIERAFLPQITTSKSKERAKQQSSEILDKASSAPTPEEVGQMADHIARAYPGMNQDQLRQVPEVQDFIRRARAADKASDLWSAVLRGEGRANDPEIDHNFKNLMGLINPIGGFSQRSIDKRTEAQRIRYLKKNKGLTGAQISEQYPTLPESYSTRIEALRKQGMSDVEIARLYPKLRPHLPSLGAIGGSSIGGSGIGGSSIGGSGIGGSGIG